MFDPAWLFLSMIPGGIGFVLFTYGKKQQRWPQLVGGVAFIVYPWFTDTITSLLLVGVLLTVMLGVSLRLGW